MHSRENIETMIDAISRGERAGFDALYSATSAKLFGVCLRVLKDRQEAEDTLQDVYVRIWQKAGQYRSNGLSPMTWLITIARNRAIDKLRARKAHADGDDAMYSLPDPAPGPEAAVVAKGEAGRIVECLGELPTDRADAVRRAYLDGHSYADLAAHFDVPLNTMRTWLRRSLQSLRDCMSR